MYFESGAYLEGPAREVLRDAGVAENAFVGRGGLALEDVGKRLDERDVDPVALGRGVRSANVEFSTHSRKHR